MPDLPLTFTTNIQNAFGERGKEFLSSLPGLIQIAAEQWDLGDITPVPDLSYNFVAFANRSEQTLSAAKWQSKSVVLKIGVPDKEFNSEIAALKYYNGQGAARLLEHDPEHSMFLLERLRPGEMLSTLEDDDARTHIAADVMLNLWRPMESMGSGSVAVAPWRHLLPKLGQQAPALQSQFINLTDWFDGLKNLRPTFNGGTGPFPEKIVIRVEETLPRLYAESSRPCLIHGDFHHFNVLSSERGWIVIDPKGVIGHPEYEVGPLLINPLPGFLNGTNPKAWTERRLDILSERLGFPRRRLIDWAVCFAVLSAWWDTTPDGTGGEYSLRCAELFASL